MNHELNEPRPRRRRKFLLAVFLVVLLVPFAIPEIARIPVQGATVRDWNPRAFWYEPWGASGVHKGTWKATTQTQGWKRMFFVDPGKLITGG